MSYLDQSEIAANSSMIERVAQCVTAEGQSEPDTWTYQNRRQWAAAPGWDAAWRYAQDTHPAPDPPDPSIPPYNPGADEACITDQMILSQVQAMLGAEVAHH
jgi:hypothetical protein